MELRSLFKIIFITTFSIFMFTGCFTSVKSYKVSPDNKDVKGGLPYFLPKAVILVKQPIEVSREETIHAVISLGGLEEFMYELNSSNMNDSISKLEGLIGKGIKLESFKTSPIYLSKQTIQIDANKKKDHSYTALTIASKTANAEVNAIIPTDLDKAIKIITVPNYDEKYELVLGYPWFSTAKLNITLSDGWKLDKIETDIGENQLVDAVKEIVSTILENKQALKIAKLDDKNQIKLKEMEYQSKKDEENKSLNNKKVVVKIKGYVKKIKIKQVQPGVYDFNTLLKSDNQFFFKTISSESIVPIHF